MNEIIKNAQISDTMLGLEDHGIMTYMIGLDYGSSGQEFGGFTLDEPIKDKDDNFIERRGTAYGMELIMKILEILEVDSWEKLIGQHIKVKLSDDTLGGKIIAIGHFLKDQWFNPEELNKNVKK